MGTIENTIQFLDQLNEDRVAAAIHAVDEHQWDRQRSPLDFDTATERLRSCRGILRGAIDSGFVATLPVSVQEQLPSLLDGLVQDIANLSAGIDELGKFASDVDQLHTYVWVNRLAEKSTRVIDYAEKVEQLARLSGEAQRLNAEFNSLIPRAAEVESLIQQSQKAADDSAQTLAGTQAANQQTVQYFQEAQTALTSLNDSRDAVDGLLTEATSGLQHALALATDMQARNEETQVTAQQVSRNASEIQATLTSAVQQAAEVQTLLAQAQSKSQEMSALETSLRELGTEVQSLHQQVTQQAQETQTALALANERNAQVDTLLAQARASNQEISTFEADLKKLYEESQAFRERITSTEQAAQTAIDENKAHTRAIEEHLADLQAQIEVALQKAVGKGLFAAFFERGARIGKGKWIWASAAFALAVFTLRETTLLAHECSAINSLFYFKLATAIPLGLAVWFCINQYGRERRLEEEYAFRSGISFSLAPYRDLVEKALSDHGEAGREKYAQFLVGAVDRIFTSPFQHKGDALPIDMKHMSQEQLKLFAELVSIALGKGK